MKSTMKSVVATPSWVETGKKWIGKVFSWAKGLVLLLAKIADGLRHLFFEALSWAIENGLKPLFIAQFFMAIAAAVLIWAIVQWWFIGIWLCGNFGFQGIGAGFVGLIIGMALNYIEIVPELWKIYEQYAKVYAQHCKQDSFESAPTPKEAAKDFFSFANHEMELARYIALLVESAINIVFAWSTKGGFTFASVAYAAMLLRLPETTLKVCSHVISMMLKAHDSEHFATDDTW